MRVHKKYVVAAALLTALSIAGAIGHPGRVTAQGPPGGLAVQIVDPLPLPVSGNIGIAGTPTVSASQSGDWTVRNLDEPGRHPWQAHIEGNQNVNSPTVPAGKRVVLQHLSLRVLPSGPNDLGMFITSGQVSSSDPEFFFGFTPAPGASSIQILDTPVTGYIDSGKHVLFATGSAYVGQLIQGTLVGYIVDCTRPSSCDP